MLQEVTEYEDFVTWYDRWVVLEMCRNPVPVPNCPTPRAYHLARFEISVRVFSETDAVEYAPYSMADPRSLTDFVEHEKWQSQWWRYVVSVWDHTRTCSDRVDGRI